MQRHKHKPILEAIAQLVRRYGTPVQLYKVKAHSGVVGNEMADEVAKEAVGKIEAGGEDVAVCDAPAYTPYQQMFWPTQTPPQPHHHLRMQASAVTMRTVTHRPSDGLNNE